MSSLPRPAAPLRQTMLALVLTAFGTAGARAATEPLHDCHVPGISQGVKCGVLQRALDPARPDGQQIDLHYVVVPAMARRKLPDPVFLLAGGPGQSAITAAPQVMGLFSRLNNRRDIVFVDQRGTGRSAPLECPDEKRESLADQADPDRQLKRLMACKAALLKLPYIRAESDLGFFTTTLAMQDLDAVRVALGVPRIDLVGISYGTRAGLEYMRQFPNAVRRAVLDAVAPPDMVLPASFSSDGQAALNALLRSCETQPACKAAYPNLASDWHALLASLPKPATATQPLFGTPERFTLTREIVLGTVRSALYAPWTAAALPAAITEAAAGRYDALLGLGTLLMSTRKGSQLAMGMHFSVVCAEDAPRLDGATDKPGADFGSDFTTLYRRSCEQWPRGAVPPAFYEIPRATTPTLLFSGGIDPATPPRHGERIAKALGPLAVHVIVPNAGHGVFAIGCARDLVFRFIDAADDAAATGVNMACVGAIPRPGVFIPIAAAPEGTK